MAGNFGTSISVRSNPATNRNSEHDHKVRSLGVTIRRRSNTTLNSPGQEGWQVLCQSVGVSANVDGSEVARAKIVANRALPSVFTLDWGACLCVSPVKVDKDIAGQHSTERESAAFAVNGLNYIRTTRSCAE